MREALRKMAGLMFLLTFLGITGCGSSIHKAASEGNIPKIKDAIKEGENINERNLSGSTPLHIAAENGHLEVVKYLLSRNGNINAENSYIETPLHIASAQGHFDIVKFLLSKGANLHLKNNHGDTPLMIVSRKGYVDIVKLLIFHGARFNIKNHYDETPEFLASKFGHTDVLEVLNNVEDYQEKIQTPVVKKIDPPPLDTIAPVIIISSPDVSRGIKLTRYDSEMEIIGKVIDESGVMEVTVNNRLATVDEKGNFKVSVFLETGENGIMVSAMDRYSNRAVRSFEITRQPLPQNSDGLVVTGRYYALIIGNNNYLYLPKLNTAKTDAFAVEKLLKQKYGFQTSLLLDASKTEISHALNSYRKRLNENDSFLVYYAGHGYFDQTVNKAYWWPVDAEQDDDTNWIIADTITANIQRMSSKHVLVVADSCYSGTLTRSALANLKAGDDKKNYLKKMLARPSRTLMASGGNEPVSDGGGGEHSVFAAAFINALKRKTDPAFTAEELFYQQIKETVSGKSSQVPVYSIIRNSGHDGGDFIFIVK